MADAAGSGLATKAANRRARVQIFGGKQRRIAGPRKRFSGVDIKRFSKPLPAAPAPVPLFGGGDDDFGPEDGE